MPSCLQNARLHTVHIGGTPGILNSPLPIYKGSRSIGTVPSPGRHPQECKRYAIPRLLWGWMNMIRNSTLYDLSRSNIETAGLIHRLTCLYFETFRRDHIARPENRTPGSLFSKIPRIFLCRRTTQDIPAEKYVPRSDPEGMRLPYGCMASTDRVFDCTLPIHITPDTRFESREFVG